MTTAQTMQRILLYGGIVAGVVAVLGGIVGIVVSGLPGLLSALLGTLMVFVFLGLTAASVILAVRVSRGQLLSGAFFGIVLGGWLLKFLLFLVLIFAIGDIAWLDARVAFGTIVAAVIGSLIVDVVVIMSVRQESMNAPAVPDEDTLGGPASPQRRGRGAAGRS